MERLPFAATTAAALYDAIGRLPVCVVLDNIRSLYNVGAFFRTADAASIEKLYLCGITGHPPHRALSKTALGAEDRVPWIYEQDARAAVSALRESGYEIAAIETSVQSVDLFDWRPRFPLCVMFGNEVDGLGASLLEQCDAHIRIPMLGVKHSLNVATAGGVVIYELLRKYRRLLENSDT